MRLTTAGARVAWSLAVLLATAVPLTAQQSWICSTPPVEPCVKRHGRLSSQDGIPLKLWLIGTKRVVALANDAAALPPEVRGYLELASEDYCASLEDDGLAFCFRRHAT